MKWTLTRVVHYGGQFSLKKSLKVKARPNFNENAGK